MVSRITSHLHIFPPQPHHLPLADPSTRQLPIALEIPEYVCPLNIVSKQPVLQSTEQTRPCISLTSGEGDNYAFTEVITDPSIYEAMNNGYLYDNIVPPDPLTRLNSIAHTIVSNAHSGISQIVVSAGPVGSGHGTVAFNCPQSSGGLDRLTVSSMMAERKQAAYSSYSSKDHSQTQDTGTLMGSQLDDDEKYMQQLLNLQQVRDDLATKETEFLRNGLKRASKGLLWMIFQHVTSLDNRNDIEWPKMASFNIDSTHQIVDLLAYPGVTEAFGMSDHCEIQSADYVDVLDKPVEYQMYFEKFSDRAQAFEGTAFSNVQDAAAAFLQSEIIQPAAKDISVPFRKAMSISQRSVHLRGGTARNSAETITDGYRDAFLKTLHLQSLYSDGPQNTLGSTNLYIDQLSSVTAYSNKKPRQLPVISAKTFATALSQPSVIPLKTDNGLITPEYLARSGLMLLNVNPCSLRLLKRSILDRRRPICTWKELNTVGDSTAQRRGNMSDLPSLLSIRKQTGMPNYSLALDACAPTITIIYLGPSKGHSSIVFIDMCTCTTQTPLQQFKLRPQFRFSLDSLTALRSLVEALSGNKKASQEAKSNLLGRIIFGHAPNLALDLNEIDKMIQQTTMKQQQDTLVRKAILGAGHIQDSSRLSQQLGTTNHEIDKYMRECNDCNSVQKDTALNLDSEFADVTFLHSVQICESDAKNTLQQLRLAASLDRKVELGFYWAKQLYNDATMMARMELLNETNSGSRHPDELSGYLHHKNKHSCCVDVTEALIDTLKSQNMDSATRLTALGSSIVKSDICNSNLTPKAYNSHNNLGDRIFDGSRIEQVDQIITSNSSIFTNKIQGEFSPLPHSLGKITNRINTTSPKDKTQSSQCECSLVPVTLKRHDLLSELHGYISKAEKMLNALEKRIYTDFFH